MKVCKRIPGLLLFVLCVSTAGVVKAQTGPFPLSEVPDANTGFRVDPANSGQGGTNKDTVGFDYVRLSAVSVP
jgi:hypothetical protein